MSWHKTLKQKAGKKQQLENDFYIDAAAILMFYTTIFLG